MHELPVVVALSEGAINSHHTKKYDMFSFGALDESHQLLHLVDQRRKCQQMRQKLILK